MIVFFLQPAALLFYIVCLPLLLLYGIRLFEEKLQQILSCQFAQFFICHICPFAVLKNGYSKSLRTLPIIGYCKPLRVPTFVLHDLLITGLIRITA